MLETERRVNPGAEQWMNREIKCLDYGFVRLVDYMGDDGAVVQAARVSYGAGTKSVSEDRGLIRYLMRNRHTTPFEMVEFKFHCKLPIFVARQWIRHRTASVNEYSGRYSTMKDEFYMPELEVIARQSNANKQGRDELLTPEQAEVVREILKRDYATVMGDYNRLMEMGVAKELARVGLSLGAYTEWYWKIDLHNLLHFLGLRLDAHAQYEIRVFANAMASILKDAVPASYEAFLDYRLNALTLSAPEIAAIARMVVPEDSAEVESLLHEQFPKSKREVEEAMAKLRRLGLVA